MTQQVQDDYVAGLLLALLLASTFSLTATGALWFGALLCLIVWTPVIQGRAKFAPWTTPSSPSAATISGVPTSQPGVANA